MVCGELFEYPVPAFPAFAPISGVAVAGNRLFVGAGGYLAAYDATGATNCTKAVPRICHPLWALTAPDAPATDGPPVVSGNTLFVRGLTNVVAFDVATGARRWETSPTVSVASNPAVANGVLFVGGSDGRLYAFDANGVTGCSATPKTCAPLWRSGTGAAPSSPSVANGVVYTGAADGSVRAFDAAGTVGCSGTPKTCTPLFSSVLGSGAGAPLVANGRLYVPEANGNIAAFATSN